MGRRPPQKQGLESLARLKAVVARKAPSTPKAPTASGMAARAPKTPNASSAASAAKAAGTPSTEKAASTASVPNFAEAMRRAGTVPLAPGKTRVLPAKRHQPTAGARAMPSFDVEEQDGWLEGRRVQLPLAEQRRLNGPPGATLDLHGHDVASAKAALAAFLERERELGRERVLVIVGKGNHTAGGVGILRAEIAGWLSEPPLSSHVLAFSTAAPNFGGSGCVVVLLATRGKNKAR